MQVVHTRNQVKEYSATINKQGLRLGFVPTMGALHAGHLSLVRQAKGQNDRVAVSIFVNPIQFNNPEDLKKYPRTLEKDLSLLHDIMDEQDVVFAPSVEEMYPDDQHKKYDFGPLETVMEGAHRPGHFNGVGVVVDQLFSLVNPNRSYFGEKDFQQLAIIRKLVEIENHRTEIIPCPIIREKDGLAMSSRNVRLTPENRMAAPEIYRLLCQAKDQITQGRNLSDLKTEIRDQLDTLENFKTDYVCFAEERSLLPVKNSTKAPFRCFIAVHVGQVRLIDNLSMY